jgi:hypothetical protein
MMKKYSTPDLQIIAPNDVIVASAQGTETSPYPDNGGIWDLDIGNS